MSSRITAIFSKTNRQHTLSRLFFLFSFFFVVVSVRQGCVMHRQATMNPLSQLRKIRA